MLGALAFRSVSKLVVCRYYFPPADLSAQVAAAQGDKPSDADQLLADYKAAYAQAVKFADELAIV